MAEDFRSSLLSLLGRLGMQDARYDYPPPTGPHHLLQFKCICTLPTGEKFCPEQLYGRKVLAQQAAAKIAYESLLEKYADVLNDPFKNSLPVQNTISMSTTMTAPKADDVNYKGILFMYCAKNKIRPPDVDFKMAGPPHRPTFQAVLEIGDKKFSSTGNTKKEAEQAIFKQVVESLKTATDDEVTIEDNPTGQVMNYCMKFFHATPTFKLVDQQGFSHNPIFTSELILPNGKSFIGQPQCTIKESRKDCCREALKYFAEDPQFQTQSLSLNSKLQSSNFAQPTNGPVAPPAYEINMNDLAKQIESSDNDLFDD